MDYKKIRVLILEGYARQSLPLIKAFKNLGCEVSALCSSRLDVAYASRYADHKLLGICDRNRPNETTQFIRDLLKTNNYDVVVPMVDFSAEILSRNKNEFEKYSRISSNEWDVFINAEDKLRTMQICMINNIPCPITLIGKKSIDEILQSCIKFPLVVKPRIGYGAIGFKVMYSIEELIAFFSQFGRQVSDFVIQEYIPHTDLQYECAMFIDSENNVKTALVFSKNRWFPVEGGSSTLNITVDRPDIVETCTKLMKLINWRGCADIDLIQDPRDGVAKIMEINPRVSGSVKICFLSGVDQAKQILQLLYREEVEDLRKYVIGQRLRCFQTDFLWFLYSPDRLRASPSWFSWRKTQDHIFAWSDPLPWFTFSIQALARYRDEMKKRSAKR